MLVRAAEMVRRQELRPAKPGRTAPEARKRGFRWTNNFGLGLGLVSGEAMWRAP